jgi:hypothetical protein
MAPWPSIWDSPSTRFRASTINAFFTCGRPNANPVRRVLDAEVKNGTLRLAVQRLGQARPTKLEICHDRDRRSPSAKKAARASYEQKLRRTLERHFPGFTITRLTTGIDLEKSFGPIYARGLLRQGQTAFAVLGVNDSETQASIDASLTFGILWLEACRQSSAGKFLVEGLRLFIPHGCSALFANAWPTSTAAPRSGASTNWTSVTTL